MKFAYHSLILLSLAFAAGCTTCTDNKDDCRNWPLEFDLPVNATGVKDTLYVGDTVRLVLDFPERLAERNNGIEYDFINYDFNLVTCILKIDTTPAEVGVVFQFDWQTEAGQSVPSGEGYSVFPEYKDGRYRYEVKFSPKNKGLFSFCLGSVYNSRFPLARISGPCSHKGVAVYSKLSGVDNPRYEYMKISPDAVQANISRSRFDEFAGFCFYVR